MGVNGTGVSAIKERIFIRTVFNRIAKGAPENMIDLCLIPADEEVYECIETMLRFGPTVALPLLDYILAVAYSDDILETYLEQKLESMFAPLLLVAFLKSGEESVPSPSVSVKLTDLESKILKWFREDGDTHTLKDAQKKFSFKSGSEVQHALDSLCDKGILYGGANMIGHTYFLNHDALDDEDDEETELDDGVLDAFSELDKEMIALQEGLEDAGIEVYPSGIGDTGFDAYNWTFTKNTRADGGSWTIAIPDGFVITDSQENRVFEAIPEDCTETEPEEARVRILPGAEQDLADHLLAHHPSAQKGLFTSVAALGAERSAEMFGEVPKHFLLNYENTYASVLIYNTGGGSYSYQCTVYDCKKSIMLRVQTQHVTDEQEKQLLCSWS